MLWLGGAPPPAAAPARASCTLHAPADPASLPCAPRSRRLLPLLRFHSSKSPDTLISLAEYVERMKEGQKHIYYLVGEAPPLRQS
jgi:hypothetical protein